MKSTLERDWVYGGNGLLYFPPKEYPDWYGIPDIGFIYYNEWVDPCIEYDGERLNSHIVEDSMWDQYREDCEEDGIKPSVDDFANYMRAHAYDVHYLIGLALGKVEA